MSLNQFVATAAAEKGATLRTAGYPEPNGRADWDAFDRPMARNGGEPPRPGDEAPAES